MIRPDASRAQPRRRYDPLDPFSPGTTRRVRWRRVAAAGLVLLGLGLALRPGRPAPHVHRVPAPPPVASVELQEAVASALAEARLRCAMGDHHGGLAHLQRAAALRSEAGLEPGAELLLWRAQEHEHTGSPWEAAEDYEAALNGQGGPSSGEVWVVPDVAEVSLRLARLENDLHWPEQAAAWAARALDHRPELGAAWTERARALLALGDERAAATCLERARTLDPASWRTWEVSARLHLARGELRSAEADLLRARGLAPEGHPQLELESLTLDLEQQRASTRR